MDELKKKIEIKLGVKITPINENLEYKTVFELNCELSEIKDKIDELFLLSEIDIQTSREYKSCVIKIYNEYIKKQKHRENADKYSEISSIKSKDSKDEFLNKLKLKYSYEDMREEERLLFDGKVSEILFNYDFIRRVEDISIEEYFLRELNKNNEINTTEKVEKVGRRIR